MARKSKPEKKSKDKDKKPGLWKRIKTFFSDIKKELKRVTWPDKKRLKTNTATVIVIILLSALIIFIFDSLITFILTRSGFYHVETAPTDAPAAIVEQIDRDADLI